MAFSVFQVFFSYFCSSSLDITSVPLDPIWASLWTESHGGFCRSWRRRNTGFLPMRQTHLDLSNHLLTPTSVHHTEIHGDRKCYICYERSGLKFHFQRDFWAVSSPPPPKARLFSGSPGRERASGLCVIDWMEPFMRGGQKRQQFAPDSWWFS